MQRQPNSQNYQRDNRGYQDSRDQRDNQGYQGQRDQRNQRNFRDYDNSRNTADTRNTENTRNTGDNQNSRNDIDIPDDLDSYGLDNADMNGTRQRWQTGRGKVGQDPRRLPPMRKSFIATELAIRSTQEVQSYFIQNEIQIKNSGKVNVPQPFLNWGDTQFPYPIMQVIKRKQFQAPTPIQAQVFSMILAGNDVIGIAQTGSGKTVAYLLPGIIHITNQPDSENNNKNKKNKKGPSMLILAPTRELAMQIEIQAKEFASGFNLSSACIFGGNNNRYTQSQNLDLNPDIVVACPGRLLDFLNCQRTSLQDVTYLVIDEADRMLDMGFENDVRTIVNQIRFDRQTTFFSATWPKAVRQLAEDFCQESPIYIQIGKSNLTINQDINQIVICLFQNQKLQQLMDILDTLVIEDKVLIFAETKKSCEELAQGLTHEGYYSIALHGDKSQIQRDEIMSTFKKSNVRLLCATDLASRGLDVSDISVVINYDFPKQFDDYIHRIGRTGRAKRQGRAFSFLAYNRDEPRMAKELLKLLEHANANFDFSQLKDFAREIPPTQNLVQGGRQFNGQTLTHQGTKRNFVVPQLTPQQQKMYYEVQNYNNQSNGQFDDRNRNQQNRRYPDNNDRHSYEKPMGNYFNRTRQTNDNYPSNRGDNNRPFGQFGQNQYNKEETFYKQEFKNNNRNNDSDRYNKPYQNNFDKGNGQRDPDQSDNKNWDMNFDNQPRQGYQRQDNERAQPQLFNQPKESQDLYHQNQMYRPQQQRNSDFLKDERNKGDQPHNPFAKPNNQGYQRYNNNGNDGYRSNQDNRPYDNQRQNAYNQRSNDYQRPNNDRNNNGQRGGYNDNPRQYDNQRPYDNQRQNQNQNQYQGQGYNNNSRGENRRSFNDEIQKQPSRWDNNMDQFNQSEQNRAQQNQPDANTKPIEYERNDARNQGGRDRQLQQGKQEFEQQQIVQPVEKQNDRPRKKFDESIVEQQQELNFDYNTNKSISDESQKQSHHSQENSRTIKVQEQQSDKALEVNEKLKDEQNNSNHDLSNNSNQWIYQQNQAQKIQYPVEAEKQNFDSNRGSERNGRGNQRFEEDNNRQQQPRQFERQNEVLDREERPQKLEVEYIQRNERIVDNQEEPVEYNFSRYAEQIEQQKKFEVQYEAPAESKHIPNSRKNSTEQLEQQQDAEQSSQINY